MKEVFLFAISLATVISLIKSDDDTIMPSALTDQKSKKSLEFSKKFDEVSDYEIDGISGSNDFQTPTECPADPVPGSTAVKLPHESACNLYYTCENGEKILSECDEGLFYNPLLQMCDWAPPAGCLVPEKPTEKPTPEPPTNPTTCPSEDPEDPVLLPHECVCSEYYLCRKGEQILQKCHADEGFSSKLGKCTALKYSDCVGDDPEEGDSSESPSTFPTEPTEPTPPTTKPTKPTSPPTEPTEPTFPPTEPTPPQTKPTKPTFPPTEPTEPTFPPTKPTKPTSPPTEPTEPTFPPTKPTKPTSPPTEPTEPTSPPTEPTESTPPPTKPTKPTSPPTEPTEPTSSPAEPTEPTSPPTKPTKPTSPPTEPTEPTSPPTKPTKPTSPPTEPTEPTSPPAEPTEPTPPPTKPTKPTSPPTEPTKPTSPPTEPTEPTNPTSPPSESTTNKWESAESCIGTCPIRDPIEYTVLLEHKDCSRFCKCSNGTPYVYKCPTDLEFSPTLKVCTYPADAGCKYKGKNENKMTPTVIEPSFFQKIFNWRN